MKCIVQDDFWELFPNAHIGIVIARGFDNTQTDRADITALFNAAIADAAAHIAGADIATHPAVAPWRQAYAAFGVKPSKFRSSIESMLRGAQSGRLRPINPLVDLYNTISLRHRLPCGGEDLAAMRGDIQLTRAVGGEPFVPLGATTDDPPQPGEVIYRDDVGVICRAWNWREADRTKLTTQTTDAFLCIEALPIIGEQRLRAACDDLATLVRDKLNCAAQIELLQRARPTVELA